MVFLLVIFFNVLGASLVTDDCIFCAFLSGAFTKSISHLVSLFFFSYYDYMHPFFVFVMLSCLSVDAHIVYGVFIAEIGIVVPSSNSGQDGCIHFYTRQRSDFHLSSPYLWVKYQGRRGTLALVGNQSR